MTMKPNRDLTDEGRVALRPTPERHRHDAIDVPPVDRENTIARPSYVKSQTTLDRYKGRKTLTEDQLAAAYRWHGYAVRSSRFPRCVMSWAGPVNGSGNDLHDSQVAAGIARDNGIKYLSSLDLDMVSIVDHVCVHDFPAEGWAVTRRLRPMKGIEKLRESLTYLAKHYGITR
jgi:hypothetical protein